MLHPDFKQPKFASPCANQIDLQALRNSTARSPALCCTLPRSNSNNEELFLLSFVQGSCCRASTSLKTCESHTSDKLAENSTMVNASSNSAITIARSWSHSSATSGAAAAASCVISSKCIQFSCVWIPTSQTSSSKLRQLPKCTNLLLALVAEALWDYAHHPLFVELLKDGIVVFFSIGMEFASSLSSFPIILRPGSAVDQANQKSSLC